MPVRPLSDRVLVRPIDPPAVTPGGIVLPENVRERPVKGSVVAVGPGVRLASGRVGAPRVRPGDVVVYGKYSGTEVHVEKVKHVIIRETELLGTIG